MWKVPPPGRERISARQLGAILLDAARGPYAAEFIASLPLASEDGTLRRRFAELGPRLRLKTGTLGDTRALAGNVQLRWIPVAGSAAGSVVAGRDSASVAGAFSGRASRAGDASAQRSLVYNHGVMDSITYQLRPYDRSKTFAFPTLVYRSGKSVKVVAGNPRNLATLAAEVASEPRAASLGPAGLGTLIGLIALVQVGLLVVAGGTPGVRWPIDRPMCGR